MRRFVATCTACALLLSLFAVSGMAAADSSNSRVRECAAAAAVIRIQLDRFPPQAFWTAPGGQQILWKPYYWAAEGESGHFRVTRVSDDCDAQLARARFEAVGDSGTSGSDFTLSSAWTKPLHDPLHGTGDPYQDVSFPVHANSGPEPIVEKATVRLSNYDNAFAGEHTRAPFYFIDNQNTGFAFGESTYAHSEFGPKMPVPVFRGGPATTTETVNFSVEGTGANPAVEGESFEVEGPKSLTFAAGQRVKVIDLSIINNQQPDGNRTFKISLTGEPDQNETEITLVDAGGDPPVKPHSRFHHPRDGWKYQRGDFRIREIHTFAFDNGGPEIEGAQFALRKKLRSGRCAWWNGTGFRGGKCSAKKWLKMKRFGDFSGKLLYTYNLKKRLDPTQNTRIRAYRAFTRVGNVAGARETQLKRGRNVSNFKVTR